MAVVVAAAYFLPGATRAVQSCDRFAASYAAHVHDLWAKPQVEAVFFGDSRMGRLRNFLLGPAAYNLAFHGDGPRESTEKLRYVWRRRPAELHTAFVLIAATDIDPPAGRRRSAWMTRRLAVSEPATNSMTMSAVERASRAIGVCTSGLRRENERDGNGHAAQDWAALGDLARRHGIRLIAVRLPQRSKATSRDEPPVDGVFASVVDLSGMRLPPDHFETDMHLAVPGATAVIAALAKTARMPAIVPEDSDPQGPAAPPARSSPTDAPAPDVARQESPAAGGMAANR